MDMNANHSSIMVIAAHPDDEVLGCGGTIARLAREGSEVFIVILGEGITSRYEKRDEAGSNIVKNLQSASRKVAEFLGAKELFTFDFPDNRFDTVPLLDIIKALEGLIRKIQPQAIYTHHGGDLNIDHVITSRAVLTATRPVGRCPVREIYTFEVPSSTEWAFGQFQPVFLPNVFVDISTTIEDKIQAMALYETETRSFPHPRSSESLRTIALRWGTVMNANYIEAFNLIRKIK